MKTRTIFFIFGLAMLVLFSGCSNTSHEKTEEENINADTDNEEEIVEDTPENDDEQGVNEEEAEPEEESVAATYEVNQGNWSITPIDDANEQVVLLTIDDAPDKYALDMAETLLELEADAIFFVNGHFIETEEQKETLKEIYEMGFMIGNHTYSHPTLTELSNEEQKEEIIQLNDMVEEITGERPLFFRAPFGINTDYSKEVVAEEGMILMNWTYGYDWESEYMSKEGIADIMVNAEELRNGANLLMHDREWTAAGLHDIVTGLKDKGYEILDPKQIKIE